MKRASLTKIIVLLVFITVLMVGYIGYKTGLVNDEPITTPTITGEQSTIDEDDSRAFIKLGRKALSISPGATWAAEITSNTWSKCLGDIYDPDGEIQIASSPGEAEALIISPGKFQWTWNVPRNAKTGSWTIRFLCGTFENLATQEISIWVE